MALAVMLPATICAGMTLPLVTYLLLGMGGGERRIGQAYGLNALGSVLGATVALELGLPALGLEGTLAFAAALDVLLGVLVLTVLGSRAGRVPGLAVASVAAGGAAVVLGLRGIDASLITSGVYRGNVDLSTERVVRMYADGATASVSLVEEGGILSIRTNGKPSASVALDPDAPPTADETVTTLLGALPVLLRPEARTGLNVGLGSGITSSILLGSTALETLTTVEIEPAMMRLSEGFADRNRPVFEDARSRIVIDDARAFLATAPDRFDYIVTQPSNPWVSGAGGLFSIEFYRMASRSLRPGGLLVQWIQASETETALVVSILQALASEFPIYDVYAATGGDLIVVASASGRIPAPAFEGMARPPLVEALERVRIRGPQDILVRKAGNQDTFGALTRLYDVRPNSEFYPVLQENAARARFQGAAAVELLRLMVQPLPVLEFLEVTRPDWTRSDVTLSPNFFYSSRAVTAQLFRDLTLLPDSLRETLTDSIRDPLALPLAGQAERLGHACMVGPTPGEALGELYAIATAVVTDLRPEELRPIWDAMADQPCVAGLAGVGPGWLQFLRTVGERDVRAVAALAPQLLAADASASPARARYAAAAGMAALLRLGRGEEALALFREHRPALFPDEPVSFFFRHLQELARTKSGA
jgi:spermidine synthase